MMPRQLLTPAHTPPRADDVNQLIGRTLGVYRCRSLIGQGGMGHVYLAEHIRLGRPCALKVLFPELADRDPEFVERFQQEGRSAATLIDPHIVTTHAIGEAHGFHYLEMEYVPGCTLQQILDVEETLTPTRATRIAVDVTRGLAAAHSALLIHHDLKPDNILMTPAGIPKIADFGLAKRVFTQSSGFSNRLAGTPNFMAPELVQGGDATPGSDVFALGVCYYLMLTGEFPFRGLNPGELMHSVLTDPIPGVRGKQDGITLEMAEVANLLLERSPANRPESVIEALQLLQAVLGSVQDIESMLAEAFREANGVSWTRSGERYDVVRSFPDGRTQTVFVEPSPHEIDERLLLISSICCDAVPEYYEHALRLNSRMIHGSLAVRQIDGRTRFVIVNAYPRETVDVEELRRSVLKIAPESDSVEALLTGRDEH